MDSHRLTDGEVLVAQGKRRRSTEGAQGTNTGHENAVGMACVGVRLTDQLGWGQVRERLNDSWPFLW